MGRLLSIGGLELCDMGWLASIVAAVNGSDPPGPYTD